MTFDPYQEWLGIPPHRRPPTHYDLLGLSEGETDTERIRDAASRPCLKNIPGTAA